MDAVPFPLGFIASVHKGTCLKGRKGVGGMDAKDTGVADEGTPGVTVHLRG